ncbi:MAG: DUF1269 domain-containing protein [Acidimicrobiales bacterium]
MADLIVLTFDDPYGAQRALGGVRALEELHYAWMDNVAVVEKHKGGLVMLHTPHGSAARGALWGGLIGLLLFWWFPPAWFFGGWLGGLGGGALIGEAMKRSGLDENLVHEVTSALTPGTSALLLIGASGDADEMARVFDEHHPSRVIRHTLSDATVANLVKELGDHTES